MRRRTRSGSEQSPYAEDQKQVLNIAVNDVSHSDIRRSTTGCLRRHGQFKDERSEGDDSQCNDDRRDAQPLRSADSCRNKPVGFRDQDQYSEGKFCGDVMTFSRWPPSMTDRIVARSPANAIYPVSGPAWPRRTMFPCKIQPGA